MNVALLNTIFSGLTLIVTVGLGFYWAGTVNERQRDHGRRIWRLENPNADRSREPHDQ